ncbi:MAG: putative peptidoglycan glycosyltransferase FtsW [Pseudomonadota bacterium]
MMRVSRADRSRLSRVWFTLDRTLLVAILILLAIGLVVSLAASPAVALRKGLEPFHFVERHVVFAGLALAMVMGLSLLTAREVRRAALLLYVAGSAAMVYVLAAGPEINGAQRWLRLGAFSLQPSEFVKPALVVLAGWLLAERQRRPDMPALIGLIGLSALFLLLLRLQPDMGQVMLMGAVLVGLGILAGLSLLWIGGLVTGGIAALGVAYVTQPYVARRIDAYLSTDFSGTDQASRAIRSFIDGGFFGRGPGAGTIKTDLPDAHTDYIFAVIAEEYGAVACIALLALYGFIAFRAVARALASDDLGVRYALIGLALLFSGQALINMGVNVGLLPATGMTLPFVSAGGSSMIAISITLGMMLALSCRAPDPRGLSSVPFVVTPELGPTVVGGAGHSGRQGA